MKGNKDSKASTSDASSFYELPKQAELNLESFNNRYAALVVENGKSHFIDEKGKLMKKENYYSVLNSLMPDISVKVLLQFRLGKSGAMLTQLERW